LAKSVDLSVLNGFAPLRQCPQGEKSAIAAAASARRGSTVAPAARIEAGLPRRSSAKAGLLNSSFIILPFSFHGLNGSFIKRTLQLKHLLVNRFLKEFLKNCDFW
jgi:hypothetical protein